jgi:hypothetical protein
MDWIGLNWIERVVARDTRDRVCVRAQRSDLECQHDNFGDESGDT